MTKNIYVGNLPHASTDQAVKALFEQYGAVTSVTLISDRFTGKPRGFGFVVMPNDAEAQSAISALNGTDFQGRRITVNEANPRQPRQSSEFGGNGGNGGGRPPFKRNYNNRY